MLSTATSAVLAMLAAFALALTMGVSSSQVNSVNSHALATIDYTGPLGNDRIVLGGEKVCVPPGPPGGGGPVFPDTVFTYMRVEGNNLPLGHVTETMNPSFGPAHGVITAAIPPGPPGTLDVDFHLCITATALGNSTFVSDSPEHMRGTLTSYTQPNTTMTKTNVPTNYYRGDDPAKTTIFTVNAISVVVTPSTSPVPVLSGWGVFILVVLMIASGAFAVIRRRRPMAQA